MNSKQCVPLAVFLIALSVQVQAEKPRRFVEIGADAEVGLANNLLGVPDIFKKNIVIDMNELADKIKDDGIKINTDINAKGFFNFNIFEKGGFGLSAGVSGGVYGNIPKSILSFIAEGNIQDHSPEGNFNAFGGVFADTAVDIHFKILKNRLRIGLIPAMYIPVVYIPKSSIHYKLSAEDTLQFESAGEINVYSPFSLDTISVDTDSLFGAAGFDLSLNVEYALLLGGGKDKKGNDRPFLNVGADITNIPIFASTLNHQMNIAAAFGIDGSEIINGGSMNIPTPSFEQTYTDDAEYKVRRPLRFDFYALFRPFKSYIFTLRPNIGFTLLNPDEETYFNAGVDLQLNIINLLILHIGTGYEETLWKHRAGLALNLRVFELDIEAGLRSQEFTKSFLLNGFSVGVGIRVGF
ncbi:MAG: hypothetical protein LBD29_09750 [Treponema sp.]|jgi:hypothetical protein|nr:hypothetical protein [Treponema sp.]